jgi:hypothetical protein
MKMRVHEAFQDGVLDAGELRDISALQDELNLPPEIVERLLIMNNGARTGHNYCPHCGESLADGQKP